MVTPFLLLAENLILVDSQAPAVRRTLHIRAESRSALALNQICGEKHSR